MTLLFPGAQHDPALEAKTAAGADGAAEAPADGGAAGQAQAGGAAPEAAEGGAAAAAGPSDGAAAAAEEVSPLAPPRVSLVTGTDHLLPLPVSEEDAQTPARRGCLHNLTNGPSAASFQYRDMCMYQ